MVYRLNYYISWFHKTIEIIKTLVRLLICLVKDDYYLHLYYLARFVLKYVSEGLR